MRKPALSGSICVNLRCIWAASFAAAVVLLRYLHSVTTGGCTHAANEYEASLLRSDPLSVGDFCDSISRQRLDGAGVREPCLVTWTPSWHVVDKSGLLLNNRIRLQSAQTAFPGFLAGMTPPIKNLFEDGDGCAQKVPAGYELSDRLHGARV